MPLQNAPSNVNMYVKFRNGDVSLKEQEGRGRN